MKIKKTKKEVEILTQAAKRARAAYQREWRRKNPDKVRKNLERYWERRAKEQEEKTDE